MGARESASQAGAGPSGLPATTDARPKYPSGVLWAGGMLLALLLLALPHLVANAYYMHIANMTLINVILVTGLNVISRTGQLSLCHAAFAGIGGYTSALLALRFGIPPIVSIFIGATVSGLSAWLIGAVILRMRGVFFVLVTFLFGQIFTLLVLNGGALTEGANGLVSIPPLRIGGLSFASKADFYYFALFAASGVVLFTWRLLCSPAGRAFASIEENLPLAESNGIDTRRFQVIAFVIGSSFAGFGGGAIAHYLRYISPDTFTFWESVSYIVMLVVGGRGTLAGGVVGALFLTPLPELLRSAQALSHVAYGVILIAVLFVAPKGIAELGQRWRARSGKPT